MIIITSSVDDTGKKGSMEHFLDIDIYAFMVNISIYLCLHKLLWWVAGSVIMI